MTSSPHRSLRHGFTVVEVLMVTLLLSSILALIVINFFSFEGALDKRPAKEQLQRAVAEGHRLARTEKAPITLRFDEDLQSLQLENMNGDILGQFDLPKGSDADITFYKIIPEEEINEELAYEAEEDSTGSIDFEAYGATAPFMVELDTGSKALTLRFDPFSAMYWEKTDVL